MTFGHPPNWSLVKARITHNGSIPDKKIDDYYNIIPIHWEYIIRIIHVPYTVFVIARCVLSSAVIAEQYATYDNIVLMTIVYNILLNIIE